MKLNHCLNKKEIDDTGIELGYNNLFGYMTVNIPNNCPMEIHYNNYYPDNFKKNILLQYHIMEPLYDQLKKFGYTLEYNQGRFFLHAW